MDNLSLVEIIDRTRLVSDVTEPILPVCCPVPGGNLRPGSLIIVYASCPNNQGRFVVEFLFGFFVLCFIHFAILFK